MNPIRRLARVAALGTLAAVAALPLASAAQPIRIGELNSY